jgi:hypothetical protein
VRAKVAPVGLNPDGTVETPPLDGADDTGWYREGPTPGELGPAVILGHVDANRRPAVFFRLRELERGDVIQVRRADGRTAEFRVTRVDHVPKAQFPTEQVYGDINHAGLRLITCGGSFDKQRSSYADNVVVLRRTGPGPVSRGYVDAMRRRSVDQLTGTTAQWPYVSAPEVTEYDLVVPGSRAAAFLTSGGRVTSFVFGDDPKNVIGIEYFCV